MTTRVAGATIARVDSLGSGVGILFAWLVITGLAAAATMRWTIRLWKKRKDITPTVRIVAWLMAASVMYGSVGTVAGLVTALRAVGGESVDPTQRARVLAEGISQAMNCTAFALVLGLPTAAALAILTRRRAPR